MKTHRALFLPSYFGGGFGHIGRCLALADELEALGWETAFAMGGPHAGRVLAKESGGQRKLYLLRRPFKPRSNPQDGPAFTFLSNMSYQLVRDGLSSPVVIRSCLAEQVSVVRQFRPDVLIADTWPLASILAYLVGLPLVQITRANIHPAGPGLIWWQEPPADLVPPDPRPVFNPLLMSLGISPIDRAEDLLAGCIYLVPSFPDLDPLPDGVPDTHYVGPFVRGSQEKTPAWLEQLDPGRPLVYITTGGGAGSVGGLNFYRLFIEALAESELQVVISTGARFSPGDFPSTPANVRLESWVPGPDVISRSRLVIFSGGYGTTMEMVKAGVPGLAIPFHSEQESNVRRLEALGAAQVLMPSQSNPVIVWHPWRGGRFSTLIHPESDLTPPLLREQVLAACSNTSLKRGAERLRDVARGYGGVSRAVELVVELVEAGGSESPNGLGRLSWWQKVMLLQQFG